MNNQQHKNDAQKEGHAPQNIIKPILNQDTIMATADDAIQSKLSAVRKGYYQDPFVSYLSLADSSTSNVGMKQLNDNHDDNNQFGTIGSDRLLLRNKMNRKMGFKHGQRQQDHHQPLIRRGTFARTCIIDYALSTFLSLCYEQNKTKENDDDDNDDDDKLDDDKDIQIVMLGSGRDTTYLRAKSGLLHGNDKAKVALQDGVMDNVRWYEIDHEKIIKTKHDILATCPLLDFECEEYHHDQENDTNNTTSTSFALSPKTIHTSIPRVRYRDRYKVINKPKISTQSQPQLTQPKYHLVGFDLCNPFTDLLEILKKYHSFKLDVPTLFIMECVQMYLPEQDSREILNSITTSCKQPFISIFDPIIQDDSFGQVMAQNLTKAKIITNPSMSLLQTRTLVSQVDKLSQCGFKNVTGCDFMTCYETIMSGENRKHANMVEMLDEIEEWVLIMKHYCFVVGAGGTSSSSSSSNNTITDDSNYSNCNNMLETKFCSVGDNSSLGFKNGRCMTRGQE